jgi:predicted transposase/invertase (TIGR01784 family)
MCRINPRVDFAFKKLFGSEENKDLLISLINAVVSEKDQVADVMLRNPYSLADYHPGLDTYYLREHLIRSRRYL